MQAGVGGTEAMWPPLAQAQGPGSLYPEPGSPWDTAPLVKAWMTVTQGSEEMWGPTESHWVLTSA